MRKLLSEKLSFWSMVILAIYAIDFVSTSIVLSLGGGEAHPFFKSILNNGGIGLFTFTKLVIILLLPFIDLTRLIRTRKIEWSILKKKKLPRMGKSEVVSQRSIRNYFIVSILCYLGIYVFFFIRVNF